MANQLKVGQSLDKFIAEKVMGWQVINYPNSEIAEVETEDEVFFLDEFKPSASIKDAWEVVETINKSRFSVRQCFIDELIQIVTPNELKSSGNLIHASMLIYYLTPFLICIAALRALGFEVEHD